MSDSDIGCGKIIRLIDVINPNKDNGCDGMINRVFSLCNPTATKPLSIMLQNCLKQNILADNWKKDNLRPLHNK